MSAMFERTGFFTNLNDEFVFVDGFVDTAYVQHLGSEKHDAIEYLEVNSIKSITHNREIPLASLRGETFANLEKKYFELRDKYYAELSNGQ